jgi:hypothetical protein
MASAYMYLLLLLRSIYLHNLADARVVLATAWAELQTPIKVLNFSRAIH